MNITDGMSVDAARIASASSFVADLNNSVNWEVVGPLCFVSIILLALAVWNLDAVKFFWAKTPFARWRERQRMRAEREKKMREMIADYVTDALEEAYNEGDITLDEKSTVYRRVGKLGYPDLLRRGELMLKEEIEKRRAAEQRDSEGKVVPIKFPVEEVPPKKRKQVAHVHVL